jgi:hypothetical protein
MHNVPKCVTYIISMCHSEHSSRVLCAQKNVTNYL